MKQTIQMIPCGYCKETPSLVGYTGDYIYWCPRCRARGPVCETEEKAAEAWNELLGKEKQEASEIASEIWKHGFNSCKEEISKLSEVAMTHLQVVLSICCCLLKDGQLSSMGVDGYTMALRFLAKHNKFNILFDEVNIIRGKWSNDELNKLHTLVLSGRYVSYADNLMLRLPDENQEEVKGIMNDLLTEHKEPTDGEKGQ